MGKYEKLVEERKELEEIFMSKSTEQHNKESIVIDHFKQWMKDREKMLNEHSSSLQEEKKAEDMADLVLRTTQVAPKPSPRPPPSIATDAALRSGIIDLSLMASPQSDSFVASPRGGDSFVSSPRGDPLVSSPRGDP